jgi:hypothetical protein
MTLPPLHASDTRIAHAGPTADYRRTTGHGRRATQSALPSGPAPRRHGAIRRIGEDSPPVSRRDRNCSETVAVGAPGSARIAPPPVCSARDPSLQRRMDHACGSRSPVLRHWLRYQAARYRDLLLNIEAAARLGDGTVRR